MTQEVTTSNSSAPLPVELLWQGGWPPAAQLFWSRIAAIEALSRDEHAADFWSGKKERSKVACQKLADLLFAAERGEEALAALMLAADPAKPQTFEVVLPQLAYAIEHLWTWPAARASRDRTLHRLSVWWRATRGDFEKDEHSIFFITRLEMLDQDTASNEQSVTAAPNKGKQQDKPEEPGLVVMPKDKATAPKSEQSGFKDLLDLRLPLVVARDLDFVVQR
jgi:ATP-dependent Lon protease